MSWLISSIAPLFYWNYDLVYFFYCSTISLELSFGCFLLFHHCFIAIMICPVAALFYLVDFIYCTTVLLQWLVGWFLLLDHCFTEIMIWLICSIAALFYCSYHSLTFFYSTIGFLRLKFGWFYLTSITPLFYCNYDLADLFYFTTVLLELWFGLFLLFQLCHCNYYLADSIWLLLLHCFISTMIWLIPSIAPLFH